MTKKKNSLVFMDVSVDGDPVERMVFELFSDVAPKTVENFRALCTGEKGIGPRTGKPLHYKGSFFHRIVKGSIAQGGDFVKQDGTAGESIYEGKFPDELPKLKHDGPGLLSMSIVDRDTLGSQFVITFKANHHLDRKYIVFGKLVLGHELLNVIENAGDEEGRPTVTVKIINCGDASDEKNKVNKLKIGKDASSDANSHELRRRGKQKKLSRDKRKKRRKHYSSESESSSDSETESSESDSDSDSSFSTSSDVSSSSDERLKRRKRSSRREKSRRRKRRDKRRERKRKRRGKRSKRKSKRVSDSLTDVASKSGSGSDSDGYDVQVKDQTGGDQSHLLGNKEAAFHKKEDTDMLEKEDGDSIKVNGEWRSNGFEADAKSDGGADGQPDVVDDHPRKSRSRSTSPRRTANKSMSISPRRKMSKSPSVSPNHGLSRSRSVSRSPPLVRHRRNISRSPVRSGSSRSLTRSASRSPVAGSRGRSISKSPVRARSRKSISHSPVRSVSRRRLSKSPLRTSYRKSISRSPVRSPRRSMSRSPVRVPSRRSIGRSPTPVRRSTGRNSRRSYSRNLSPVRRVRSPSSDRGKSLSRSASPDGLPKQRIRRGRGFSQQFSYARQYRTPTPDCSPVRYNRHGGRGDRERYTSYGRYSPIRYRSPRRSPPRYRSRRSRSPSVSRSPRYRRRHYSRSPKVPRSRASPRGGRRRSPLRSRSKSRSRSPSESRSSLDSQSPKRASKGRSNSSTGSPDGKKGLVSYDDGTPDSGQR